MERSGRISFLAVAGIILGIAGIASGQIWLGIADSLGKFLDSLPAWSFWWIIFLPAAIFRGMFHGMHAIMVVLGWVVVVVGVANVVAGIGLLRRIPWSRTMCLILSPVNFFFSIPSCAIFPPVLFPSFVIYAVLSFFTLLSSKRGAEFNQ